MITQLYKLFKPRSYNLSLAIDSDTATFTGNVTVHGTLTTESNEVLLHAKELTIISARVNGAAATVTQREDDILCLQLDTPVAESIEVALEFSGVITDAMHGMYPCYFEHEGVRKKLIATQFESHHAREVFPCIDEPAAKATFDLTLTTPADETVLANTPVKNQRVEGKKLVTQF
jgi:aminopeptidase N